MELNYEETMQRIAEYEKKDIMGYKYCKEKNFRGRLMYSKVNTS